MNSLPVKQLLPLLLLASSGPLAPHALAAKIPPNRRAVPFRVVIDPGHGGSDQGTFFTDGKVRVAEKNVTLALAFRVADELRAKGYTVYLTREEDIDLPLGARTALANRLHADVFLSIHMNSTPSSRERTEGIETYILNNTTEMSSKRLAQLENSVLSSYDTSSPEQTDIALILKDLRLDANLAASKRLACAVQRHLVRESSELRTTRPDVLRRLERIRDRGVRQALFHVLLGADMPSVLVEAGFLNSMHDRQTVLAPKNQSRMGRAIAQAIEEYRRLRSSPRARLALSRVSSCKIH